MADFTGKDTDLPVIGQVVPRMNKDLGAVITATAQGAGTLTSGDLINSAGRGVRVTLDLTKNSGTIDVTVNIYRKDKASGKYVLALASASKTVTGTFEYVVHPDLAASANVIAQNLMSEVFKVEIVSGAGTTPNFDATVGVALLP